VPEAPVVEWRRRRSGSSQNSTDVISTTSWLKFTYEHQFAMKISGNHCCHVIAMNRAGSAQVAEWNGARAVVRSKGASFFNADGAVLPAALSRLRLALSAELPMPSILRHLSFCCSSTHFIFSFFCRVFRWLEVRATEFMVTLRRFAMVSRKIYVSVSHGHLTCTPVSHGHSGRVKQRQYWKGSKRCTIYNTSEMFFLQHGNG
jgi:hypothetical protein